MKEKEKFSRRGFLKTAAVMGATLTVSPALDKVQAASSTDRLTTSYWRAKPSASSTEE